jgi:hypothetical protein
VRTRPFAGKSVVGCRRQPKSDRSRYVPQITLTVTPLAPGWLSGYGLSDRSADQPVVRPLTTSVIVSSTPSWLGSSSGGIGGGDSVTGVVG